MNNPTMRTNLFLVFVGMAVVLSFNTAQPAMAEPITFIAQGTVHYVDSRLAGTFSIGDTFRVVYTFESLTPDSSPTRPDRGDYFGAITDLSVTVGTYSATAVGRNYFYVFNNLSGDQYGLGLLDPMLGPSVNGFDLSKQSPLMQLRDPTSTALTSDALPTSPPDPADFISGGTFLALEFVNPLAEDPYHEPDTALIEADVSWIIIPEPITLSLDILPGDGRNPFVPNKKGMGKIPMAILGSEEVAAEDMNPESIKIAGSLGPVKISTDKDVDGDGLIDLMIYFSRRSLIDALSLDAYDVGDVVDVTIKAARIEDDWPIEATDSIVIVGRKD